MPFPAIMFPHRSSSSSGTRILLQSISSQSVRRRRIPARFSDFMIPRRKVSTWRIQHSNCWSNKKSWLAAVATTTTWVPHANNHNTNDFISGWPKTTTIRWYHQSSRNEKEQTEKPDQDQDDNDTKKKISAAAATTDANNARFWGHWMQQLKSPPNIITTARILSTPVLAYWIISGQHEYALVGCVVAAASDYVDGYLAKNYNMATVMGGYLDPFADKVFINVLACSLCYTEILPLPLVGLWLARDVLLFFGAAAYVRSHSRDATHAFDPLATPLKVNSSMLSKTNTLLQFVTLGVGIVYPLYTVPPEFVLTGLCYLTGVTTIASGVSYLDMSAFDASGNTEKEEGKDTEEKKEATIDASQNKKENDK